MVEEKGGLEDLRSEVQGAVKVFIEKLQKTLGDNLVSLTVVGSSLTADFRQGKSDINTVLVVHELTIDLLDSLAGMGRLMGQKRLRAPILMTNEYIAQSRDVFGIEFLDFQLNHKTVFGDDPFAELTFEKADVRLGCERELKASLIRLRQGYIAAVGKKKMIEGVLAATGAGLVPLFRAVLWLNGAERPVDGDAVFTKAAEVLSVETGAIAAGRRWRYEKSQLSADELSKCFGEVYKSVEQMAEIVDKLEV